MIKKIILLILLFISIKCDYAPTKLLIFNNTNKKLFYCLLPDTLINKDTYIYAILPFDSNWPHIVMGGGDSIWEYKINKDCMDSALHIFFFETDKLNDSLIKGKKYKRLDLKVKDLERLNWKVIYDDK